jgi:MSHA pilin protein MshC
MPDASLFPCHRRVVRCTEAASSRDVMKSSGFTMIELIVTLMIIGILAVAVIPRFTQIGTFEARTFFDDTITMVRYGQKAAIAQRTNVFFNADAATNTVCLSYVTNTGCAAASPVLNPASGSHFLLTAPNGVTLGASLEVSFSGLGVPSQGAALTVTGDGTSRTLTIEAVTGFAH